MNELMERAIASLRFDFCEIREQLRVELAVKEAIA
jgi:hypothetical protein